MPQVFVIIASWIWFGVASVQAAGINDTGVVACSDDVTNGLACPVAEFPFQDADFGSNGFNFTKLDANGSELPADATDHACVRDNVTGLIWEVKTSDGGVRDKNWTYSWYDTNAPDGNPGTPNGGACYTTGRCDTEKFIADVNIAGLCGFTNWRMPVTHELTGIIHYGIAENEQPSIDTDYFPDAPSEYLPTSGPLFATGSVNKLEPTKFLAVYLHGGAVSDELRSGTYAVRLVKGDLAIPVPTNNFDGTITDQTSGLMWTTCPVGQKETYDGCTGNHTSMTWQQALMTANHSEIAGYKDWRLPNIKDLQTLTYLPFATQLWSSSPMADPYDDIAWSFESVNGYVLHGKRTTAFAARFVRLGQPPMVFNLLVNKTGTGTGVVSSNPSGIDCGSNCKYGYVFGTTVLLSPVPTENSTFTGWTGDDDCVDGTVTINANKVCTATFMLNTYTYTVSPSAGTGGTVNPNTPQTVNHGAVKAFTVTPNSGYNTNSTVGGTCPAGSWSSNVYTTGAITADCTVSFSFTIKTYTVTPTANSGGVVNPNTPQTVNHGATKGFTVTPNSGYSKNATVGGSCSQGTWNGDVWATGPIVANCTVIFGFVTPTTPKYTLNILNTGSGTGTIKSTPTGINCGNQCAAPYNSGDTITLTATANADSTFGGWTGAECNGIGTCTLQLTASSADQTIAANFETNTPQNLGAPWTTPTSPTTATIKAIIWRDNLHNRQVPGLIAVSTKGEVLTSLEGNSWIARNIDNTAQLHALVWTGTTLVAAGGDTDNTARIYTSVDAITWQSVPLNGQTLHALLWNPFLSKLLAVGAAGKIYSGNANGQSWTAVTSPTPQTLHAIANNATRNVAVGLQGTIITSTDGNTWTLSTSNTQANLYTVLWNGYQFLAAGDKVVLTSPDGLTWTNIPTTFTFHNVEWNGSRYFAVGPNGILSSVTGHTWTTVYTSAKPLQDIVWTGTQLLAGGDNGLIARANLATNQNATALQVSYDPDETINIILETTATNRTPTGAITLAVNDVPKARLYNSRPEYGLRYQGKVNNGAKLAVEYHGDEAFEPSQDYIVMATAALHKTTESTDDNATLQVHVTGKGKVTTPLAREQINCDSNCTQIYRRNRAASVTLRATPNPGHTFAGWSGGCSGSADTCTIIMNTAQDVTATFASSGAATAPNVNTDPPSNVTITYATLKGWVNDNGADTTAAFDFGTTTNYGTKLDAVPKTINANTGATSITASKAELLCATTYHYRATATNGKGTINAPGVSFTTSPCLGVKHHTVKIIEPLSNGIITPAKRQVPEKGHATFTATANTGYTHSLKVTGTCPTGFWRGDIWTTGAITADCQVGFTFSLLGDANGDGKINSLDLKAAAKQIFGITPAGNADCNEDNIVDARDVVCVAGRIGKP